ncbi:protein CHROMATIN REMODELING 35 [Iris pallida]|uniref:Protein CHROMATIN REMODELING 35 n=1 Tax=Iris pallida TaxID=29817 RepID=A0AAX6H214_IRIPA|nr:protein CHROMATIN REMODELING 35 [Iris pallida]
MHLARNKRLKLDDDGLAYSFLSKNATLADQGERTPTKVVDYSDARNLFNVLQDEGKYGSVTKEYEALHTQRMRVMNFMSAMRSFSRSKEIDQRQHAKGLIPQDVIDVDAEQAVVAAGLDHGKQDQRRNAKGLISHDVIDVDTELAAGSCIDHGEQDHQQHAQGLIAQDIIDVDTEHAVGSGIDHGEQDQQQHAKGLIAQDDIDVNTERAGGSGMDHDKQVRPVCTKEREEEEGNDISLPTVVDSDGKNEGCDVQEMQSSSSDKAPDFQAWLRYQIQLRLRGNKLFAEEGQANHLQPYVQGVFYPGLATEWKKVPSIRHEKVVLGQPLHGHANRKQKFKRGEREGDEKTSVKGGERRIEYDRKEEAGEILLASAESEYYLPENRDCLGTPENGDGLDDLWRDMSVAMECSKDATTLNGPALLQDEEYCNHSFLHNDELGLVCRVCGVVQKSIETLFDYQWTKGKQTTRTYVPGPRNFDVDKIGECSGAKIIEHFLSGADISIHPRHMKQMKPHQIEGFNFLVKNLLADSPGGCILAHAPGSGKTFMLISFIQSFMAKDPHARPLVVLPKGILTTWKKEFQRWKIEDIPLYDFYSAKADSRSHQLEILNTWHENRSILLLGYKQFSNIICEGAGNKVTVACQDKLLMVPTLLILDEGHNPRNDETDMVGSLAKVRTRCKVVLSGTLFQNHVEEVFNILKLVRPNFMKTESSRTAVKRIRSMAVIPCGRRPTKGNTESYFCELVEETLRNDENYKRRVSVIQELRGMTRDVLHYYKGDFLDELPGLVDFTVLLNISKKQKDSIQNLGKLDKFRRSSMEKAIYMHPQLVKLKENATGYKDTSIDIQKVDNIIGSIDVRDGAKTKFFMNLLSMAESSGEKLLVFSQYLLPLKFLERLIVLSKGWRLGKEFVVIYGDSSPEDRELSMEQFNKSPDAKVFFGSIKACGEGISLVGASRVLILDVHLNPSVTLQAIGRAFRPGQEKKVYVYRLVAADAQEEEDHKTSFRKELISKMWFEWTEYRGNQDFELDAVNVAESGDMLLQNLALREDIKALYRR